jgi:hypothetical protein
MASRRFAALAALILVSTPVAAFDLREQHSSGISFFYSIPLDGRTSKEQAPNLGLTLRGNREHQVINLDTRTFGIDTRGLSNGFLGGGIEMKWIIAGVVATGAVVAIAAKDKKTNETYQEQQQIQQQSSGGSTGGTTGGSTGGSTGDGTGGSTGGGTGGTGGGGTGGGGTGGGGGTPCPPTPCPPRP